MRSKTTDPDQQPITPCEADAEMWYSTNPLDRAEAVTACGHCPALTACGELLRREMERPPSRWFGIWAGTDLDLARETEQARAGEHLAPTLPCSERLMS